jgi:hypothetical protein
MRYEKIQRGYGEHIWVRYVLKQAARLSTFPKTGPATQLMTSVTRYFSKCPPRNKMKYIFRPSPSTTRHTHIGMSL